MIDKQRLRTFLLGGAIGALAGVFLAPRSGRELRTNIANRAEEARERSRETYFDASERLQEKLSETRGGASGRARAGEGAEISVESGPPYREPESFTERPNLRDVSGGEPADQRPDELRKKVQETRSRLRAHLESSLQDGNSPDRDE